MWLKVRVFTGSEKNIRDNNDNLINMDKVRYIYSTNNDESVAFMFDNGKFVIVLENMNQIEIKIAQQTELTNGGYK